MKTPVVGDLHGDWGSLNRLINKKQPNLVLQCGDFGHWHTNVRGKYRNTRWECLDYPHNAGGKWWTWLR